MTLTTENTADILRKAASDVEQGMWCIGSWFKNPEDTESFSDMELWGLSDENGVAEIDKDLVDRAQRFHRCAEGSISLATAILGLSYHESRLAIGAVEDHMGIDALSSFNDAVLPRMVENAYEAGQYLGEQFRKAADAISG